MVARDRAARFATPRAGKIGERAGKVINKYKMAKHFELEISDGRSPTSARPSRSTPRPRSTGST